MKTKKQRRYIKKWVLIQTILFILPILIATAVATPEMQIREAWCEENYNIIFEDSKSDLLNWERTNEDNIRTDTRMFDKCEAIKNHPLYYFLTNYLLMGLFIGLMCQLINFWWYYGYQELNSFGDVRNNSYY